ncbi:MAG: L,D-transpeptidase family protein [Desulfobacterales bacterium]|nr:L,D-transpeptidase family protein [Desulfobacterales bacterium]
MFYFPKPGKDGRRVVMTYPIGIGKVGWATPSGKTKIVSKRKDPWWTPPASVRKEHAAEGDPLPARVPPGPDNPLGNRAMNLGWPSYLIHGTNKPAGVGLRASHGCIRMYPEDVAQLFDRVAARHQGDGGEPAAAVPLARRQPVRAVLPAARGTARRSNKQAQAEQRHALFNKAISDKMPGSA